MSSPILDTLLNHAEQLQRRAVSVPLGSEAITIYAKPLTFVDALIISKARDLPAEEYAAEVYKVIARLYEDEDGNSLFDGDATLVSRLSTETIGALMTGLSDGGADIEEIEGKSS